MNFHSVSPVAVACLSLAVGCGGDPTHADVLPNSFGDSSTPRFSVDPMITDGSSVEFIEHIDAEDDAGFGNWLGMNLPFGPAQALLGTLESELGTSLMNRGEAHITVITPPEYVSVLRSHLSIEEIHQIARDMDIQGADVELVCVGRGQDEVDDRITQTYYLVVRSTQLLEIRREVFRRFTANGGEPSLFDPDSFWPHITIGFPETDIFSVRKGTNSCWGALD